MTKAREEYDQQTLKTYFEDIEQNKGTKEIHDKHVELLATARDCVDKVKSETTAGSLIENPLDEALASIEEVLGVFE